MTPESIEKEIAEFREIVAEAKLLRDEIRGLLDDLRTVNKETRRLQGTPDDDETPKRPALELVKSDQKPPDPKEPGA